MFHSSPFFDFYKQLEFGSYYWFRDWPNSAVPKVAAGVYTVWNDNQFIYVGMSGRDLTQVKISEKRSEPKARSGLYTRLEAHASGRRSGDQFCVYVSDRLVLPILTPEQIHQIHQGKLSLDRLVKEYIHQHLSYRFVETVDGETAFAVEKEIQKGVLTCGKPFLNLPSKDISLSFS